MSASEVSGSIRFRLATASVRQYGLTRSIEGSGVTDEGSGEEEVCLLLSWVAHWGAPSHMQSARGRLAAKSEEADHE